MFSLVTANDLTVLFTSTLLLSLSITSLLKRVGLKYGGCRPRDFPGAFSHLLSVFSTRDNRMIKL